MPSKIPKEFYTLLYKAYSSKGRNPVVDPKTMFKILTYAYSQNISYFRHFQITVLLHLNAATEAVIIVLNQFVPFIAGFLPCIIIESIIIEGGCGEVTVIFVFGGELQSCHRICFPQITVEIILLPVQYSEAPCIQTSR